MQVGDDGNELVGLTPHGQRVMRISNHYFQGRSRIGWPGYDRQRWQWEPTLTVHDPSPPMILEDAAAPPATEIPLRTMMGFGMSLLLGVLLLGL